MTELEIQELIAYWVATASHDKETMDALYTTKRYDACLFFGHIILEKILKALVVEHTKEPAMYTHDLMKLSYEAGGTLPESDLKLLATVNDFNIRSRYPDYKTAFYKKCTKEYTDAYLPRIVDLYTRLCQKMKHEI